MLQIYIEIKKQPSASTNPINQLKSGISETKIIGLSIGIILKLDFNLSFKPLFKN